MTSWDFTIIKSFQNVVNTKLRVYSKYLKKNTLDIDIHITNRKAKEKSFNLIWGDHRNMPTHILWINRRSLSKNENK